MADDRPIGMFDSGFGGLTVARASIDLLPAEDFVYLGDNGRYPYGPRPLDEVREYAMEIAAHLIDEFDIKFLVVACNTATAAAIDDLDEAFDIPVLGVIEPGARSVVEATRSGKVGVIGTVGTIDSGVYDDVLFKVDPSVEVVSCACPGFVEFVERGNTEGPQVNILAERLLAPVIDANVDTLLLGCTHYPFLARAIGEVVGPDVVLVSSADETAFALAHELSERDLRHAEANRSGAHHFISSGDVREFTVLGSRLLGPELADAERWITDAT